MELIEISFRADCRFDDDLKTIAPWANSSWSQTDLQRLKRGRVTAQVMTEINQMKCL